MTRTEATARLIEIMREFVRVHDADIGDDAMFEYVGMADDAKEALALYDSTTDSDGGWQAAIDALVYHCRKDSTADDIKVAFHIAANWLDVNRPAIPSREHKP